MITEDAMLNFISTWVSELVSVLPSLPWFQFKIRLRLRFRFRLRFRIPVFPYAPFVRRSWSLRSGNVVDQSQQKCRFFAEIQVCCKFFQLQPKRVGFLLERKRKFSSWVAVEKICSRHWTKARRTSKSGTNGSI